MVVSDNGMIMVYLSLLETLVDKEVYALAISQNYSDPEDVEMRLISASSTISPTEVSLNINVPSLLSVLLL